MRRLRRRWLAPVALLLPLLLLTNGSGANGAGVYPAPFPGLPNLPIPDGMRAKLQVGAPGSGLSEVARARQWVKIPAQAATAYVMDLPLIYYPSDDPEGRYSSTGVRASLFLSSPTGAQHGYGIGLPITVRTVAFGAVPVEVDLRLEQLRDAQGLPVPLELLLPEIRFGEACCQRRTNDSRITGKVRVRLTALSIDGVDVGLKDCASAPIELDIRGNRIWGADPLTDPRLQPFPAGSVESANWLAERNLGWASGGGITGEVDIPPFSRCYSKTGEDLSPLLTGSVSGPGNAVSIGWASVDAADHPCFTPPSRVGVWARGPFEGDPSDCDPAWGPPTFDYPTRPN